MTSRKKRSRPLIMIAMRRLMCCAMLTFAASAQAAYDVTIAASGSSSGGTWVGNTWTPSASGSIVLASEIATHLSGGPTVISTAGAGADNGDIIVNGAVSWSANKLTLTSARNINIKANLNGSGTASLYLQYGFGTGAGGYYLGNAAQVNLPAGGNFSTQLNATGIVNYTVITSLGVEGDATVAPGVMTLQGMNTGLAGNYVLGADINNAGDTNTWNGGLGFAPVGTNVGSQFTGIFDGLGHTITGLTFNRVWEDFVGLFGYASGTLRNIGLLNSSISGRSGIGTLAGLSNGTISYSYADGGSVTGNNGGNSAGGLQGGGSGSISNSYANVSVTGVNTGTGGLKGTGSGNVSNSYATGNVAGNINAGGLVGQQPAGTISNSYSTGTVTGNSYSGGLTGGKDSLSAVNANVSNSYWNTQTSGWATSLGGTGKTTALMQTMSTFNTWSIANSGGGTAVWRIYEGASYPLLTSFLTPLTVTANVASKSYDGLAYSGGNGVSYSVAPNANLLGTASYGGTSQGAINVGSYVITPSGLYSNQKGYDIAYVNGVLTVMPSYTAASATGSGNITATFSGGGAGCLYTVSQYIPLTGHAASPPAGSAPAGVSFPHGLFDFTTGGCTAGSTITMAITYPQALPAGTMYWKYGPSPAGYNCSGAGCAVAHWYQMPPAQAVIAGNTVTLTITDGGVGDDDLTANGVIVDQGGPGVPGGGVAGIPTLSEWGVILLAGMLVVFGMAGVRRGNADRLF